MRNIKTYVRHINESNEQYDDVWFIWGHSDPEEFGDEYSEPFRIIRVWDEREKAVDAYKVFKHTHSPSHDNWWVFNNPVTGEVQKFSTIGMDGLKTIKGQLEEIGMEDAVDFDFYLASCDTREIPGFEELPAWGKDMIKRRSKTKRLFGI